MSTILQHHGGATWLLAIVLGLATAASAGDPPRALSNDPLDAQIAELIRGLGEDHYLTRERAQRELIKMGTDAFEALCVAESNDDPEIATQAGYLVRLIRVDWTNPGDPRLVEQIFKDYELQGDEQKKLRVRQLAELPDDLGLEWLCRIVRFEKSAVVSKYAALCVLDEHGPFDDATWRKREAVMVKSLERGRRAPVQWLQAYLRSRTQPEAAVAAWTELANAEKLTLEQHPRDTTGAMLTAVMQQKIALLDRIERRDAVREAIGEIIAAERGEATTLANLMEWLTKRKEWDAIETLVERFETSFEVDAVLMYLYCEALWIKGDREQAELLADKALKATAKSVEEHLQVYEQIQQRGLFEWSDRELRYVLAQTVEQKAFGSAIDVLARHFLTQNLHDRDRDLEAAMVLQPLIDEMDRNPVVVQLVREVSINRRIPGPESLRAQRFYLLACHAASQGDAAKQRELLDKALQNDPGDIDALIAAYHVTAKDPDRRAEILRLINRAITESRQSIDEQDSDLAIPCNQIAWLVANTEGNLDEAITLSKRSVDLARVSVQTASHFSRIGTFLDTLAHCYYAKKDYAAAVKTQLEAVRLEPHMLAISRKLEVFRQALAQQQASDRKG